MWDVQPATVAKKYTCFIVFTIAEQNGRQYPDCIIKIVRTLAERHYILSH